MKRSPAPKSPCSEDCDMQFRFHIR
jgi:hypothetical protein